MAQRPIPEQISKAKELGIEFPQNIGADTLQAKIDAKLLEAEPKQTESITELDQEVSKIREEAEAMRVEADKILAEARDTLEQAKSFSKEIGVPEVEEAEEGEDMNILQALNQAQQNKVVARRGWSKHLGDTRVVIKRGETKPRLANGRHSSPYTPSIYDTLATDWYILNEKEA